MKKRIVILGILAVGGHLVGVVADVYSGYVPSVKVDLGTIASLSFENIAPLLSAKPLAEARVGHFLAIVFIPMGIFGIYQVYLGLRPGGTAASLLFFVPGVLGLILASFYHGTLAFVIAALHARLDVAGSQHAGALDAHVAYVNSLSEPLSAVLLAADVLITLAYVYIVLFRSTLFPRWMAAVNPLTVQLMISVLIWVAPHPLNQLLWLTVFNLSLATWYVVTTLVLSSSIAKLNS